MDSSFDSICCAFEEERTYLWVFEHKFVPSFFSRYFIDEIETRQDAGQKFKHQAIEVSELLNEIICEAKGYF